MCLFWLNLKKWATGFGLLKLPNNKIAFILYSFYSHKTKHLKNKPRFSVKKKLGRTRRLKKLCIAWWTTSKHVYLDILDIFCCFVHGKCVTNLSEIAGLFLLHHICSINNLKKHCVIGFNLSTLMKITLSQWPFCFVPARGFNFLFFTTNKLPKVPNKYMGQKGGANQNPKIPVSSLGEINSRLSRCGTARGV